MLFDFLANLFSTTSKPKKSNFDFAVEIVLKHEGVYSYNPKDKGGATNWGISTKFLKSINYQIKSVKKITRDEAIKIYRKYWWDKNGYENINNKFIAAKILDMAVNMGENRAHKLVQLSLQNCGKSRIVLDGIFGPRTLKAINSLNAQYLHEALRRASRTFYLHLVDIDPSQDVFKYGWVNRASW